MPNEIQRDFHADKPNKKWLTDITEFKIGEGKVYLSPIIDCFDGMPITWTVGTSPNAELVNTMLDNAIVLLKKMSIQSFIVIEDAIIAGQVGFSEWMKLV